MRKTEIVRKTKETDIRLKLNLDGNGNVSVQTGIGFLDHILTLFAFHADFDLTVTVQGDLVVDDHHTCEDTGIALGQALSQIWQDKQGVSRYGFFILPMDEVLARVVVDISGRSFLAYHAEFKRTQIGDLAVENIQEFFRAVVRTAGITLHAEILTPGNDHHQVEALFKCFGRALKQAVQYHQDQKIPSTKGKL